MNQLFRVGDVVEPWFPSNVALTEEWRGVRLTITQPRMEGYITQHVAEGRYHDQVEARRLGRGVFGRFYHKDLRRVGRWGFGSWYKEHS